MIWVVVLGFAVAAAWLATGVAAIILIARGLRGERKADHVHCHPCGYALDGLPVGQAYCPECGADLRRPRAVRARRKRRWRPFVLGCALLAFNAALPGALSFMDARAAPMGAANAAIGANTRNPPTRQRQSSSNGRTPNQWLMHGDIASVADDTTVDSDEASGVDRRQREEEFARREAIAEFARLVRSYEAMLHALGYNGNATSTRAQSTLRSRDARLGFDLGVDLMRSVPVPEVRGDIARIVFHLSVRERVALADDLEAQLRRWHADDPVDEAERLRGRLLSDLPVGGNPFIADPSLVDQIADY